MLTALSFPLQVYFNSPLPSLCPYLVISLILALNLVTVSTPPAIIFRWNIRKPIELVITIVIGLVLFQTGWQTLFNFISIENGLSAIVIFIFPVIFFIYFKNGFTKKELESILVSMALAGFIVGSYFAYDSISKLVFGKVSEYAIKANEYSIDRMAETNESGAARIIVNARSMGLLEKHSVSSAWISIGCFAALSLLSNRAIKKQVLVLSVYGVLLALGLNFTGFLGFLLVVFLVEFRGYYVLEGVIDRRRLLKLMYSMGAFSMLILIISVFVGDELIQVMQRFIGIQFDTVLGTQVNQKVVGPSYFEDFLSVFASFPSLMMKFPPGVLIGDGFTGEFGVFDKGGDYGIFDTLCRFGIPLFLVIFIGFISLIRGSLKQIRSLTENSHARYLQFAAAVMTYILFSEIHYSVWSSKANLPVVFLSLAIFSCYLVCPYGRNSKIFASPPVLLNTNLQSSNKKNDRCNRRRRS